VDGPGLVGELLAQLDILPESVLVIRGNELLTRSDALDTHDTIEIRPVISGGS